MTLKEALAKLKADRDAALAVLASQHDATMAPVKHVFDALPEALKVKEAADKAYAKAALPIWERYDKDVQKTKDRYSDEG